MLILGALYKCFIPWTTMVDCGHCELRSLRRPVTRPLIEAEYAACVPYMFSSFEYGCEAV